MRRISSKGTFFYKKIFPVVWFSFLAVFLAAGLFAKGPQAPPKALLLVIPVLMTGVGYLVMKNLIFDLLDEVWDDGDNLVLLNGGDRDTIRVSDIMNVSDTHMVNPPRITLLLRAPCRFGREISFSPPRGSMFSVFKKSPIAQDLIARVHKL
ncbi:MAG: hypothetical protein KGL10_03340 [Alphaproteobacteria bacterium]|nr:hypothetical protein [Alphaproteobacteria bacterium]MDE2336324.1 hypothetical protein [Alphaproteobacteria bacterium]